MSKVSLEFTIRKDQEYPTCTVLGEEDINPGFCARLSGTQKYMLLRGLAEGTPSFPLDHFGIFRYGHAGDSFEPGERLIFKGTLNSDWEYHEVVEARDTEESTELALSRRCPPFPLLDARIASLGIRSRTRLQFIENKEHFLGMIDCLPYAPIDHPYFVILCDSVLDPWKTATYLGGRLVLMAPNDGSFVAKITRISTGPEVWPDFHLEPLSETHKDYLDLVKAAGGF